MSWSWGTAPPSSSPDVARVGRERRATAVRCLGVAARKSGSLVQTADARGVSGPGHLLAELSLSLQQVWRCLRVVLMPAHQL
eukprot:1065548-Prorocentrum_minimum.AAC.1